MKCNYDRFPSFDFNGFTVGSSHSGSNSDGDDFVAWCWKAGGSKNTFNVDDEGFTSAAEVNMAVGNLNSADYNQDRVWSNSAVTLSSGGFDDPFANAFNGNPANRARSAADAPLMTITFNPAVTIGSSLFIQTESTYNAASFTYTATINGATYSQSDNYDTTFSQTGSLTQITIDNNDVYGRTYLELIKIDGKELVDSGLTPTIKFPSIAATGCSVGTKQGFSIIKYTGNSTANSTLPHGLSEAPKFVIIKNLSNAYGWAVLHTDVGTTGTTLDGSPEYYMLQLDSDADRDDWSQDTIWNPTSTTIKIDQSGGAHWVNNSNSNYIMYAWHDVPGLQKFGSYTGNGDTGDDGPFIELGFRPAIIWFKRIEDDGYNWNCYDTTRSNTGNPTNEVIRINLTNAEEVNYGNGDIDVLANGFKIRNYWGNVNAAGKSYIYCAWAEVPSVNLFGGQSNAR